jgi:hypothetical protein
MSNEFVAIGHAVALYRVKVSVRRESPEALFQEGKLVQPIEKSTSTFNPASRSREGFILGALCEHRRDPLGEEKRSEGQSPMFEAWYPPEGWVERVG